MQNQNAKYTNRLTCFWILTLCTELNAKDVLIINFCSVNMYTKLVQVLHFEMLLTSLLKTNQLSLCHAVVRLCNWQRSKTRTNRRTKAKKEDVSRETRTYDSPTPTHTPISLLPSKFKTAAEAVCKHTLKQTNSYRTERACTGYGENPTCVHLFKIRTSTQNFVFPQVSDHHPAPTDSELSCTCCCQSSQIQSHHSHPSVSALVKDKYKLFSLTVKIRL